MIQAITNLKLRYFAKSPASILIFTIWVLTTLAVFALYTAHAVNQRILIVKNIEESENLHFIAEAGIKRALLELKAGNYPLAVTFLGDDCTNNREIFKDMKVGSGTFSVSYEEKDLLSNLEEIKYGFIDEERKINVNQAPPAALLRLLQLVANVNGLDAKKIAQAIADYRDSDTSSLNGVSEEMEYSTKLKNLPFETTQEVRSVPGVTSDIFKAVESCITVYGNGKVNINTTSSQVLEALGLRKEMVKKLLLLRSGPDGIEGTPDDIKTDNLTDYLQLNVKGVQFSEGEKNELEGFLLSGLLSTRSTCVLINSSAALNNKKRTANIRCVYELSGKIRYWQENIRAN